jgi:hypothetical protein
MDISSPRKPESDPKVEPITDRLATLLEVFSPWDGISLTYKQFAAELGAPVTVAAMKKWPNRKKFPTDAARSIVAKAEQRGLQGVTLEWVLWGDGPGPKKKTTGRSQKGTNAALPPLAKTPQDHRRHAAQIAEALLSDLSHNEFGQWSSVEVQHTLLWALKDLARRLWVLRFSMGETFKLTDEWSARVGLPVRQGDMAAPDGEPATQVDAR